MGLFLIPILAATIAPSEQFCLANAARTGTPCLMWSGRDLRSACHGGIHAGVWGCFSFLSLPRPSRQANNSASRTQLGRGPRALCGAGVTSGPPDTAAFLPAYGVVSHSYPWRDRRAKRTILPRERSSDGDPVPYVEHSCRHWVSSCRSMFLRHRSHNPLPCRS